ncbi:MAG: hypothetical protein KDD67_16245 [Ignavibacteriae bacterium]|nr:hypothetical protein [Ignavibacteriota bacterium]MCB9216822.1 hypothetical protein [Ignavibacteria bacterium]
MALKSRLDPTEGDIQQLVQFLSQLYADEAEPVVQWEGSGGSSIWPIYRPDVEEFFRLASQPCWSDYTYDPIKTSEMINDVERIRMATLEELKAMLTWSVRGERFTSGHWRAAIESGTIRLILERLREWLVERQSGRVEP